MAKRLLDVLLAGVALLLLAPLLALIALIVRLDSPGPVLYRQQRVGRYGQLFEIHKFRSMRTDAGGPQITASDDARITRSGRWLRASKLDELPQLWDVLRGAMSLVGPRPEVPRYVAHYPPELRRLLLSVRPGITDLASIEYRDEGRLLAAAADPERCYLQEILPAKLALQQRYVQTHSLGGDLWLLLRTVAAVLRR